MGQVPDTNLRYLIIGNGKVATHFQHYFNYLNITFSTWARSQQSVSLTDLADTADVVLILIKDSEIDPFIQAHPFLQKKKLVHFSGSLNSQYATGAHPLMTFHNKLYEPYSYELIHFVGDTEQDTFKKIFPKLKNRYHFISKEKKAFYHALCVMSGNFTQILWQKMFSELDNLGIGKEAAIPYFYQVMENLIENPNSLTGPLARNDIKTIEANLAALKQDEFQSIYQAFWKMKQRTI